MHACMHAAHACMHPRRCNYTCPGPGLWAGRACIYIYIYIYICMQRRLERTRARYMIYYIYIYVQYHIYDMHAGVDSIEHAAIYIYIYML